VIGPDRVSLSQLDVARTVREAGLICSLNDSFTDSESTIDLGVTADLFDDGLQSFPGQKILIVGMSGRLMPATASLLSRYGADVTIAADPASGFRGSPDARIYHLRSFTLDACRAMIETVRPSLVIHAVALDLIPGANTENYLWDHVITDTEVIRRAVVGTDVERIVSVHDWGGISTGSYPARLSALGEAILLNDSALARVEIRVVRVSATRSLRDDDAVRELPVALLMAAIANPGDSGIVVGRDATMGDTPGPMYLSERAVAGKQDGLWTVMTPLYPADETLKRALDKDMTAGRAAQRREWVDVATAPLYDVLAARADSRTGN